MCIHRRAGMDRAGGRSNLGIPFSMDRSWNFCFIFERYGDRTAGARHIRGLDQVHSRVLRTGVSFYTALSFSAFVLALAIICGLFLFVIGLIITIPLALLVMLPLVAATLGAYFLLLYGYQAQLRALRTQIQLQHLDVARSLAENI